MFHGIALWFDCKFTFDVKHSVPYAVPSITLSTSPWSEPTHWKQTVIVTAAPTDTECQNDDNVRVEEDDVIGWELSLKRTMENNGHDVTRPNRQYSISIESLDPMSEEHPVRCKCMLAKCALMQALLNDNYENVLDGEEILDVT